MVPAPARGATSSAGPTHPTQRSSPQPAAKNTPPSSPSHSSLALASNPPPPPPPPPWIAGSQPEARIQKAGEKKYKTMYASYQDHHVCHDDYFQENILLPGGQQVALPSHILSRVDLEIAFGFEKLLNLEMLVMEVARRAADIEPLMQQDPQSISAESVDKAFEFHVLYAIVDSEANELEKLVDSIRMDIANAETKVSEEEPGSWLTYKLNTATDSLKQMQELISTIRRESATFDKTIQPSHNKEGTGEVVGYENGHLSPHATLQADDQRNFLQMLQQSIASELDLQKKAFDSQSAVEDLKLKLRYAEQELYFLEESTEALSQLFLGTSKELVGTINTIQSSLSASVRREGALKSKLEESLMKLNASQSSREIVLGDSDNNASQEAVQMQTLSPPEFLTLWNKIQQLEVWLRDSGSQPQCSSLSRGATEEEQNMIRSERFTLGDTISDIKTAISNAESRTQKAETKCAHLTQTNVQLNGELNSLKSQGSDRAGLLETKLKESDTQLEHARASVDAIVEQQGMLRSSMSDMEHVIGDLKEKYLKAETRAENAESKCSLLTDTNLELSEELSFLRGRVESLENSLHQANQLKMSTAKDIGGKTKTITDLVAKLALERERLHTQIVTLTKKNRILAQKCKENDNGATSLGKEVSATEGELRPVKVMEEASLNSSKEPKAAPTGSTLREKVEADEVSPLEDESGGRSTLETVRSIEPALLNWRYISAAVLVLLAAVLVYQPYQSHDRVQQLLRKILG